MEFKRPDARLAALVQLGTHPNGDGRGEKFFSCQRKLLFINHKGDMLPNARAQSP